VQCWKKVCLNTPREMIPDVVWAPAIPTVVLPRGHEQTWPLPDNRDGRRRAGQSSSRQTGYTIRGEIHVRVHLLRGGSVDCEPVLRRLRAPMGSDMVATLTRTTWPLSRWARRSLRVRPAEFVLIVRPPSSAGFSLNEGRFFPVAYSQAATASSPCSAKVAWARFTAPTTLLSASPSRSSSSPKKPRATKACLERSATKYVGVAPPRLRDPNVCRVVRRG